MSLIRGFRALLDIFAALINSDEEGNFMSSQYVEERPVGVEAWVRNILCTVVTYHRWNYKTANL